MVRWGCALLLLAAGCGSDPGAASDALDGGGGAAGAGGGGAGQRADAAAADATGDAAGDAAGDAVSVDAAPERVPVFVAYGHGIRTMLSCDDGATWVGNQYEKAEDDDFTHDATAARSLVFDAGRFVIAIGWGGPGRIRTSEDGVSWNEVFGVSHDQSIWTAASGNGVIVLGEGTRTWRSVAGGSVFSEGGELEPAASHLQLGFGAHDGGRFVAAGDQVIHVSSDHGASFSQASVPDDAKGCLGSKRGPVYGGGVFLITSSSGAVCRSVDGGATWSKAQIGFDDVGDPLYYAGAFWVYRYAKAFRSTDGAVWTEVPSQGVTRFDALAASETTGTILALSNGTLYRSSDATTFEKLPAASYDLGGAGLQHLAFGWALPSSACALP